MVWRISKGRKVSKKSAFPTNFDFLTVFKGIVWIQTNLLNDQNLTSVFLARDMIEAKGYIYIYTINYVYYYIYIYYIY